MSFNQNSKGLDNQNQAPYVFNFEVALNQSQRILAILFNTHEGNLMGIMAVAGRIMELKKILKKQGYNIGKRIAKITTPTCVKAVAEYYLIIPSDKQEE